MYKYLIREKVSTAIEFNVAADHLTKLIQDTKTRGSLDHNPLIQGGHKEL
jgi:hypothetical protein